jgi:hypothetical protein
MTGFRHACCYTASCPFDKALRFDVHRHIKLMNDTIFRSESRKASNKCTYKVKFKTKLRVVSGSDPAESYTFVSSYLSALGPVITLTSSVSVAPWHKLCRLCTPVIWIMTPADNTIYTRPHLQGGTKPLGEQNARRNTLPASVLFICIQSLFSPPRLYYIYQSL